MASVISILSQGTFILFFVYIFMDVVSFYVTF